MCNIPEKAEWSSICPHAIISTGKLEQGESKPKFCILHNNVVFMRIYCSMDKTTEHDKKNALCRSVAFFEKDKRPHHARSDAVVVGMISPTKWILTAEWHFFPPHYRLCCHYAACYSCDNTQ